ncbi:MAG: hypothetical protein RBS10_11440 [Thauera propionica]|jgi:chromosome segregation ATPase|nr:hypothetical protein [Thauera propionica]
MSRKSNYSRAVREAAENIPVGAIESLPQIIELRRRAEKVEERHQALCARHRKVRESAQALEERIKELKTEIESKRAALPGIALEAFKSGDIEVRAAVDAREALQQLVWQLEAATDALAQFRTHVLPAMQTEGEQSGNSANTAASAVEEAIEEARLEMAAKYA